MDINYVNKKDLKILKICLLYDFRGEVPLKK